MNKKLLTAAIGAAIAMAPVLSAQAVEVKWFGFMQIMAEQLDEKKAKDQDGMTFSTDRIRIGFKLKDGNVFAKLQVDFEKGDKGENPSSIPEIIKDAEVGYKFNKNHSVKAGIFKTPLGMDFNTSGKKLDITKRGMEKSLVLERATGVMLSGRKISGFGYDVFFGDPANRSAMVGSNKTGFKCPVAPDPFTQCTKQPSNNGGTRGDDTTTAFRISYDMGKSLHLEASSGKSEQAGGAGTEDYKVTDFAVRWKGGPWMAKFEYIDASNLLGVKGVDSTVWYAHGTYKLSPKIDLVVRHYDGEVDDGTPGGKIDLQNTYVGATFYLGSTRTNGRLQVNFVSTGGDDGAKGAWKTGLDDASFGYLDDAILIQYQASF